MSGNDLIDDYLSELMDDPGSGKPGRGKPERRKPDAEPAATTDAGAASDRLASETADASAADLEAATPLADDAEPEPEPAADPAPSAMAEVVEAADPAPAAAATAALASAAVGDPLAAFREGAATISDDEFEAMLDAMQGAEPAAAAPAAAATDPLAAFRDGAPTISDDEFEAMLDAMQGAPVAASAPPATATPAPAPTQTPASAGGDPLAAFRDGAPTIGDDEFEAMLDALQGAPPATAAAAPPVPAPPPPTAAPSPPPSLSRMAGGDLDIAPTTARAPPRIAADPTAQFEAVAHNEKRRRADDRISSWLRFNLARQSFAVEVLKVQEVLRVPDVLPVRGTGPAMLGVMNLRGQIVPVMDLAIRLGFGSVDRSEASRVIVLEENGETLGLLVASVADVVQLSDSRMERISGTPSLVAADVVRGISRREGNIIIMLDATRLLA